MSKNKCFFDEEFIGSCSATDNPYYLGDAGKKIADVLSQAPLGTRVIRKKMTLKGSERDGWYR